MLRHTSLYNPVAQTRTMREDEFKKYIQMYEMHDYDVDTLLSEDAKVLTEEIKQQFYNTHKDVKVEKLDQIWGIMEPRLQKNYGLAAFTANQDGASSEFFFPWLINMAKSPSLALELAYGAGEDLNGKMVAIPKDDPIDFFIRNDPAFIYNRERQLYVADLAFTVQDNSYDDVTIGKIVDFGAGRLAWARWHGFFDQTKLVKIYAFDKDPSIEPKQLFSKKIYEKYINYKTGDLATELTNPDCEDASLVILGGVASYIPTDTFAERIIPAIYQLLKPGGFFFFDWQVDCPCLQWSVKLFSWPDMHLPANTTEAIAAAEKIRTALWQKGLKFTAEYAVDGYNECPTAVMITFQKV